MQPMLKVTDRWIRTSGRSTKSFSLLGGHFVFEAPFLGQPAFISFVIIRTCIRAGNANIFGNNLRSNRRHERQYYKADRPYWLGEVFHGAVSLLWTMEKTTPRKLPLSFLLA